MNLRHPWTTAFATLFTLALSASHATAQCGGADVFEDNDTCSTATVLAPGSYTGLTCQGRLDPNGADADFYRVTVASGEKLTVLLSYDTQASRKLALYMYDVNGLGCGDPSFSLRQATSTVGQKHLHFSNTTGSSIHVALQVVAESSAVICSTYDLDVAVGPDPCAPTSPDDSLEDNDTCSTSVQVAGNGAWTDLLVTPIDFDFYKVTVQAGEILVADITYDPFAGQLGMELYDDSFCTNSVSLAGYGGEDRVYWTNTTGAAVDITCRVFLQAGEPCNFYDMQLSVTPDPCVTNIDDSFAPNSNCGGAATLTPGTYTDLYVSGGAGDFFTVTVPGTDVLVLDLSYLSGVNGELGLRLWTDDTCSTVLDSGSFSSEQQVTSGSALGVTQDFSFHVYPVGIPSSCNGYELSVSLVTDPCLSAVDDPFEDNDTCGTPLALTPGVYPDLFASATDGDYFEVTVLPGERLIADVGYPEGGADLSMAINAPNCAGVLDWGGSSNGAHAEWANFGSLPEDVVVSIEANNIDDGACSTYDLILQVMPDVCLNTPDDSLEPNDDCTSAASIGSGLETGLYVHKQDTDYYSVTVFDGDVLDVTLDHSPGADVRLHLYLPNPVPGVCGDGSSQIVSGFGPSNATRFAWTNDLGSGTFIIEVMVSQWSNEDCATYSLLILNDSGETASALCFGDGSNGVSCPCGNLSAPGSDEGCTSSLGIGATLETSGSPVVAQDDLSFRIAQARPSQPSMLVQGSTLVAFPFKDGILCMGNPTERMEVIFLDVNGEGSSVSSIVTEGNIAGPGETRYYQAWYRDPGGVSPCGSGSNFTHGLRVDWI